MSLVLDTGAMKYRESPTDPWRPLVIKAGMNWESMADTYDPDNGTYEVGQYVLEDGMMYRCIYEIATPEAWTPAHWTSANVADELASFIIISDDQPTEDSNKIWIAETTSPFGVQIPTMDDHNALGNTLNQKAAKVDLTNISQTSPNCTVTNGIAKGTYFYLDGVLTRATATIAQNASFTAQNTEMVTAGGLNELNNKISYVDSAPITITAAANSNVLQEVSVTIPSGYTAIGFSVFQETLSGSWNVQLTYLASYKCMSFYNYGTSKNTWTGFVRFLIMKN